eukprot:5368970-Amphidinium_carterae.1
MQHPSLAAAIVHSARCHETEGDKHHTILAAAFLHSARPDDIQGAKQRPSFAAIIAQRERALV